MEWAAVSRRTHLPASLPARNWTLALLQVTSAVGLVAMASAPLGGVAPTRLYGACAAVLVASAVALAVMGRHAGDRTLFASLCLRIAVVGIAVANAHSAGATLFAGAGLIWVALWVTAFMPARAVRMTLLTEMTTLVAAAASNAQPLPTMVESIPTLTGAVVLSIVLSQVLGGLRHEARHDPLTGLLNRRGLDQAVRELSTERRFAGAVSLVAIDLDGLKQINDRFGHLAGDQLLTAFATALQTGVRGVDLVARAGGDEFIAVLPGYEEAEASLWAANLRESGAQSWSFGVAQRKPGESFEDWLVRADQRMYMAKEAGRMRRLHAVPTPRTAPHSGAVTPLSAAV